MHPCSLTACSRRRSVIRSRSGRSSVRLAWSVMITSARHGSGLRGDDMTTTHEDFTLQPIGYIRSTLQSRREAPKQGSEGAPDAWLDLDPAFAPGLLGLTAGEDVIVITWLHQANREVLEVHPRRDPANPLTGVFFTRSPDRPESVGTASSDRAGDLGSSAADRTDGGDRRHAGRRYQGGARCWPVAGSR